MKNILVVKFGALGDVIRTSYFARDLKKNSKLFWITAQASIPLLAGNPHIDVLTSSFQDLNNIEFDHIFSLDDESETLKAVKNLRFLNLSGAFIKDGRSQYTQNVSEWFDMGLLSMFGKSVADKIKKDNIKSHGEIFKKIFDAPICSPSFFYPKEFRPTCNITYSSRYSFLVGINPYAGGRWPSKELPVDELESLIKGLLGLRFKKKLKIILLGSGEDRVRNNDIKCKFKADNIFIANTDSSLLDFAFQISQLNYLITSDSLALHLSLSQGIRSTAFFAPTSAAEIDTFGICDKVISLANDYCNYSKFCNNKTITGERLLESLKNNIRGELI